MSILARDSHRGTLLAHRLERIGDSFQVDGKPLIFHHFQSLELHAATRAARTVAACSRRYRLTGGKFPLIWTTGWRLTDEALDALWEPHVARIGRALAELRDGPSHECVPLSPLRGRRVAFHVARRQIPDWAKTPIWRIREAAWRSRRELHPSERSTEGVRARAQSGSVRVWRAVQRIIVSSAGRTYARTERALERLLVDRRLHLPPEASRHIALVEVGFDAAGRRSYRPHHGA